MAEKGFGVKEINLIGASGTPTIESPNNLNLNAVNVAISTNVSIGGTLSVTGNVSVGGTLTYEDVTNIDSVGLVTAREGVFIPDNKTLKIGNTASNPDFIFYHDGTSTILTNNMNGTTGALVLQPKSGEDGIKTFPDGAAELYFNSNKKLETSNTGVTVTGTLVATTFSGSGASLTSLPAANLTGTLPAISGANLTGIAVTEAPVVDYTITADGGSNYYFHGGGVDETDGNPDLYLIRGQKYRFNNTTGTGHPFRFTSTGNANAGYSNGVTGTESGVQFWTIPYDAPAKLFYVCTIHGGMVGNIYIRGANGQNDNVGLTTFSGQITANDTINLASTKKLSMAGDVFKIYHATNAAIINESGNLLINQNVSNKDIIFSTGSGPTEAFRIDASGNVGLGTNTVGDSTGNARVFTIARSDANGQVRLILKNEATGFGNGAGFHHAIDGANAFIENRTNGGYIDFSTNNSGSIASRVRIDSDGISGNVKNNFLLNEFKRTDTSSQSGALGTSFSTDNTINLTISNYQRGQRIIIRACVPAGIALQNSSGVNYGGTDVRVKVAGNTSGGATYSNNRAVWYRADGVGTHETTQNVFICVYIPETSTDFTNGETLTVTIEGRKNSGSNGTTTHYLGGWATSKEITSERYIKEL